MPSIPDEQLSPADVVLTPERERVEKTATGTSEKSRSTEMSFMERVWERMELNWERMEQGKAQAGSDTNKNHSDTRSSSNGAHGSNVSSSYYGRRYCQVPFWLVVAVPITSAFLIACSARFCLEFRQQRHLEGPAVDRFNQSGEKHRQVVYELVENNTALHHSLLLRKIHSEVKQFAIELPDRDVDGLWGHMKTRHQFYHTLTGATEMDRWELGYAMWEFLSDHRRLNHSGGVIVGLQTGAISAVQHKHLSSGRPVYHWVQAAPEILRNGSDQMARQSLSETGSRAGEVELEAVQNVSVYEFYAVQARIAAEHPSGRPRQAWSAIHAWSQCQEAMVAWTSPIAYCGNYSCFEGVVAGSITLASLKNWCDQAWHELAQSLDRSPYDFEIHPNGSSVFIVQQAGRDPAQVGLLIGASGSFSSQQADLMPAIESPQPIVRNTAQAILQHHDAWDASTLHEEASPFAYRVTASGDIDTLVDNDYGPFCDDCQEVATLSVDLDDQTRWLVVLVLPVGAFKSQLGETEQEIRGRVNSGLDKLKETFENMRLTNIIIFLSMVLCSLMLGAILSAWVSRDLRGLSRHMRQLSKLDFCTDSAEFQQLLNGRRSSINDVRELQDAFCRLAQSVRTFGRFVPESVVRNIVRGNERALRLHVSRKDVTVMFSDIRDFTSISESLSQTDLLFVLTRYLTVMTQLVEHFGGVVTEILGDGVLAFWNTPETVKDHATKACAAALAQHQALVSLNEELAVLHLPQLGIRTALHTGMVLSGNLGSTTKMKFGCMGDTVNLASRLESLCTKYDVGIVCSGETREAAKGVVCRSLDLVQVKGRTDPTLVCEVVGRDGAIPSGEPPQAVAGLVQQMKCRKYEAALAAFHRADFIETCTLAEQLLKELPGDKATTKLLHRAWYYICPDEGGCVPILSEEERAAWTGVVVMTDK